MKHKFLFSIFVIFFISILIALGSWQIYRLIWKLELINEIETSLKNEPVKLSSGNLKNYLKVNTSGVMDFENQIYLYSLNKKGEPGFEVITPILIDNKNYLLNRGWISFDKKNFSKINAVNSNKIAGILRKQTKANRFKPENDTINNYWFTLNRDDILKFTGKNFSPFIIYQTNNNNKLFMTKVITSNISNNHKKYAITWFSLAISILLIYLYFRKKNY